MNKSDAVPLGIRNELWQ